MIIDSARWINTVKLSASSQSRPGDQFGYSISSRDSDRLILIGKTELCVSFFYAITNNNVLNLPAGAPQSEFMEEENGGQVYLFAPIEPALGKTFGTITRFNTTKSAGPATKILDTFHNIFDTWGLVATVSINSGRIKEGTESRITPVGTKNRNTRSRLESASEYDSELYEMGSGSINSLSYGSSVAFLNDVILIGDELGYGKTNYTGVVHIDNNIYKYLSHHIDTFAEAVGDGASEAPKKQKTNELLSTSKVGIMLLIAIPMISLAVFFLFCANYNKVMCEIDRNNIRKPMMGKEVQDGTIASEMKDIINFHNEEDCEGGSIRNELDHRSQFMMTLPTQLSNFLQGKSYRRGYQNDDHEVTNFAR